ncbi:phage integrase SAM-like domain-containing protein [Mariniflexile gromovii]|uniref:Site-specific integrase n=1 Tax=Mariniflexile gromovii TaxID=362523 RepID=A0ABS4BU70_9FLAO|nr:site-specific integrase [Mariniflexile gromovii]MBP0904145.1 site-specific integrase [Mariniflexile gromovii]
MASVQVVLRKKGNGQNLYPITIRITKDRKTSYISTGQYIGLKFWDKQNKKVKKSHPNASRINLLILRKLAEANDKLLDAEINEDFISASQVTESVKGKDKIDFFALADMHLDNLKNAEKYSQHLTQKGRVAKFKKFVGKDVLHFKEITIFLLKNFEGYILNQEKRKPRTAVNYMILIRKIYNLAISEGLAEHVNYPFGKGKIQIRIPESDKVGLSIEEVKKLENATNLTIAQQNAVNVWLTSFYFAGIRVSDVLQLRKSDFKDGRLLYRMNKNQKVVSLKVPEKAKVILELYNEPSLCNKDLIFPYLRGTNFNDAKEVLTRIKTTTRTLNRRLEIVAEHLKIDKKLSMHIARHSFGNISGDKIPIQMLQKLYRHSSITTTINYQSSFMKRDTDDALDKVINF